MSHLPRCTITTKRAIQVAGIHDGAFAQRPAAQLLRVPCPRCGRISPTERCDIVGPDGSREVLIVRCPSLHARGGCKPSRLEAV